MEHVNCPWVGANAPCSQVLDSLSW